MLPLGELELYHYNLEFNIVCFKIKFYFFRFVSHAHCVCHGRTHISLTQEKRRKDIAERSVCLTCFISPRNSINQTVQFRIHLSETLIAFKYIIAHLYFWFNLVQFFNFTFKPVLAFSLLRKLGIHTLEQVNNFIRGLTDRHFYTDV